MTPSCWHWTPPGSGPPCAAAELRFSPHFYNTEEEIDRAVAVLP